MHYNVCQIHYNANDPRSFGKEKYLSGPIRNRESETDKRSGSNGFVSEDISRQEEDRQINDLRHMWTRRQAGGIFCSRKHQKIVTLCTQAVESGYFGQTLQEQVEILSSCCCF